MPHFATRLGYMRLRLTLAALAFSALAIGGAPQGHAQTSTGQGSATAPAPACYSGTGQSSPQNAQNILDSLDQQDPVVATTTAYVAQFYPVWFSFYQSLGGPNKLIGPDQVTPVYNAVVAINVDTIYASAYLDLKDEPVILTIPSTPVNYSIVVLDSYGDTYTTGLQANTPGVYALIGPGGFSGMLPTNVTQTVALPLNAMVLAIRIDRHTPISSGPPYKDVTEQADAFRTQLKLQTRSLYLSDPNGGATQVLPVRDFAFPFKLTADEFIARIPIVFLRTLQFAVKSPRTPPMRPFEQDLSSSFDALFGAGVTQRPAFGSGAQLAYELIVDCYKTHTGPTNWVHFDNIGNWNGGKQVVQRSAITEFCQFCNNISAAAYYHAFKDAAGQPLTGKNQRVYVLTFATNQIPQAKRFWSLTAYTPETIELIPNPAQKYVVGNYTPGLVYNGGSVAIYMSAVQPPGVPSANWLPVSPGRFNVMLRIYGPLGNGSENYDAGAYLPPGILSR